MFTNKLKKSLVVEKYQYHHAETIFLFDQVLTRNNTV